MLLFLINHAESLLNFMAVIKFYSQHSIGMPTSYAGAARDGTVSLLEKTHSFIMIVVVIVDFPVDRLGALSFPEKSLYEPLQVVCLNPKFIFGIEQSLHVAAEVFSLQS